MSDAIALIFAAQHGDLREVQRLITKIGVDPNCTDEDGFSPIFCACQGGHLKAVKFLFGTHGVDLNVKTKPDGATPVHIACQKGHREVVQYLQRTGQADMNAVNNDGETPIFIACQYGHLEIVKFLKEECGADVNVKDKDGRVPLHGACASGLKIVRFLVLECKADWNVADKEGFTPLHSACQYGHLDIVEFLHNNKKADMVAKIFKTGITPIYVASQFNHLDIVTYLYETCKVDVNASATGGWTPLHIACQEGHLEVVKHLLEKCKANVAAKLNSGHTPLDIAKYRNHSCVVAYLEKFISKPTSSPPPPLPPSSPPSFSGPNKVHPSYALFQPSLSHLSNSYSPKQLSKATGKFSASNLLGHGGFGDVFHGVFQPSGTHVAVKRLRMKEIASVMGTPKKQMKVEIETLSRYQHPRLVTLLGFCDKKPECIVYAYMSGGSLENRLARKPPPFTKITQTTQITQTKPQQPQQPLTLLQRVRIGMEVCEGLAYLHRDANMIHRDIKSANILLDEHDSAKICDFGIVRENPYTSDPGHTSTKTSRIVGTTAYCSPEYMQGGKVSEKLDVYGFGVVLLELLTGLPASDSTRETLSLAFHCQDPLACLMEGNDASGVMSLVDRSIQRERHWPDTLKPTVESVARLASRCLSRISTRPRIVTKKGEKVDATCVLPTIRSILHSMPKETPTPTAVNNNNDDDDNNDDDNNDDDDDDGDTQNRNNGNDIVSNPVLCGICISNPSTFIVAPCGHLCVCDECFKDYKGVPLCPTCGGPNNGFIKVQTTS